MSKRLEEIKKREYFFTHLRNGKTQLKKDWDWLIKQAYRVEELESVERDFWEMEKLQKDAHSDFMRVQKINQRYKQALNRVKNYYPGVPNAEYIPIEMLFEIHEIVRKALEESD